MEGQRIGYGSALWAKTNSARSTARSAHDGSQTRPPAQTRCRRSVIEADAAWSRTSSHPSWPPRNLATTAGRGCRMFCSCPGPAPPAKGAPASMSPTSLLEVPCEALPGQTGAPPPLGAGLRYYLVLSAVTSGVASSGPSCGTTGMRSWAASRCPRCGPAPDRMAAHSDRVLAAARSVSARLGHRPAVRQPAGS